MSAGLRAARAAAKRLAALDFPYPEADLYTVRDPSGRVIAAGCTEIGAWNVLMRHHSGSVSHALRHEGWSMIAEDEETTQ